MHGGSPKAEGADPGRRHALGLYLARVRARSTCKLQDLLGRSSRRVDINRAPRRSNPTGPQGALPGTSPLRAPTLRAAHTCGSWCAGPALPPTGHTVFPLTTQTTSTKARRPCANHASTIIDTVSEIVPRATLRASSKRGSGRSSGGTWSPCHLVGGAREGGGTCLGVTVPRLGPSPARDDELRVLTRAPPGYGAARKLMRTLEGARARALEKKTNPIDLHTCPRTLDDVPFLTKTGPSLLAGVRRVAEGDRPGEN